MIYKVKFIFRSTSLMDWKWAIADEAMETIVVQVRRGRLSQPEVDDWTGNELFYTANRKVHKRGLLNLTCPWVVLYIIIELPWINIEFIRLEYPFPVLVLLNIIQKFESIKIQLFKPFRFSFIIITSECTLFIQK